jgi:RimJ/RimL family protein N-acetyltransferase
MPDPFFSPAYRIETERLVIRCWSPADAPLLAAAMSPENVEHLRPWMPWVNSEPEALEIKIARLRLFRAGFDRDENYVYGIFNKAENRVLGGTGLHPRIGAKAVEIGYWLHKDVVRQGLATETAAALTKAAFEIHKYRRVEIHCDPANQPSAKVAQKLGYTYEATLRERFEFSDTDWKDSMIWTLFADQYPASPSARIPIQAYDAAGRRLLFG